MGLLRSPAGAIVNIPDDQVASATAAGYAPVALEQAAQVTAAPESEDRGALGAVNAAATGFLGGATLGLSDYALKSVLDQGQFNRLAAEREGHPIAAGIGQIAGTVAPALVAPESLLGQTPAGILGHAAADAVSAGRAAGGVGGTARVLAAGAVEGAVQNAGAYLSDTALGDRELSAEGLAGALGTGFEFGVGGGIAALGIEQGTIAARRMFSRVRGADKAALDAEQAWKAQYQTTVDTHEAAADIARARLAEAQAARQQAGLARQRAGLAVSEAKAAAPEVDAAVGKATAFDERAAKIEALETAPTPAGPAAAPPAAPGQGMDELAALLGQQQPREQIMSAAAEAELAADLAAHDAARHELDDVLSRVTAPEIEPGVAPPSYAVPIGEFGAPGARGYDPGNVKAPGPPSVLEAQTGEVTAVGRKKLAEGTPADVAAPPELTAPGNKPSDLNVEQNGPSVPDAPPQHLHVVENEDGEQALVGLSGDAQTVGSDEYADLRKQFTSSLSPEERRAVIEYSGNEAYRINKTLRRDVLPDSSRELIGNVDAALSRAGASRPMRVYRGLVGERSVGTFEGLNAGDRFADRAYASASTDFDLARRGKLTLAIDVPTGYPAATIPTQNSLENEILLRRDTTFQVKSIARLDDGHMIVHVDVVPTTSPRPPRFFDRSAEESARPLEGAIEVVRGDAAQPPATDTLTGQLRGTQEKLLAGEALKDIGAPARAEYAAQKAVKTEQAAGAARGKAIAAHEIPDHAALTKELDSSGKDYFEQTISARKIAEHGYYEPPIRSGKPGMSLEEADPVRVANARKAIKEGQREPITLLVSKEGKVSVEGGRHRLKAAIEADAPIKVKWSTSYEPSDEMAFRGPIPKPTARSIATTTPFDFAKQSGLSFDPSTRNYFAGTAPAPVMRSAVQDVAETAAAVTKYERASAKLTETLGPAAPPAAQESAKAFRAAEDAADRKTMDRTTRAIDDHVEAKPQRDVVVTKRTAATSVPDPAQPVARAKYPGETDSVLYTTPDGRSVPKSVAAGAPTSKQKIASAQSAKAGADVAFQKTRIAETEASIGSRAAQLADEARSAADAARPAVAGAGPQSALGAIATTIGVAGELGVPGVPHPHDIPIIGPLLGTYLKYKALKAAAGRFVGRVPATGDARAAALAARVKDKIATAVDRTLGVAEAVAPKVRGAVVATTVAIGRRVFDDGEPDAAKDASAREQAAVRIREIATAASRPEMVTAMVRKQLHGIADPDLIAAAEQLMMARMQYLADVSPKAPPENPYAPRKWAPNGADTAALAKRLAVMHDPEEAFKAPVTRTGVDALQNFYPKLYEYARRRLTDMAGDIKEPVEYKQRLVASRLFDVPVDRSLEPGSPSLLQSVYAPPAPTTPGGPASITPTPSVANATNLTAIYQTDSTRRAAMR